MSEEKREFGPMDPTEAAAEIAELAKEGAQVQSFAINTEGGGAGVLRGFLPMFLTVAAGGGEHDEETRKAWWRGFIIEAHLIGLEQIGMEEAEGSFMGVARIIFERIKAQQTKAN